MHASDKPHLYIESEVIASERLQTRPPRSGAHLTESGADFVLRSPHASKVLVCLVDEDEDGNRSERRYALRRAPHFWQGHIPGVQAGQLYGYRIEGVWNPQIGQMSNPAKFLLDPYARAVTGTPQLSSALYGCKVDEDFLPIEPLEINEEDSLPFMPCGVLTEEKPREVKHPYTRRRDMVVYEAHVKGFTQLAPDVPEDERGTYKGFAHPSVISYIKDLGVTTVELLPIHAKMDEPFLTQRGLTNYWGYNTLAYFAPELSYATLAAQEAGGAAVIDEVKAMVDAYHEAGLEIILDVVYNHTCEGKLDGTTVSWRGIDQSSYYMSDQHDPGRYLDTTGCGNSLDFRRQSVMKMTLDSLRYWVQEIGVDGFRFDLAATLGRNGEVFDSHHPFYMALVTDPVLSSVKLVNEPWDLGPMGWQTGNFPGPTCDWNDYFRDSAREFWLGSASAAYHGRPSRDMRDFATRLAGSADLFGLGRAPGGRGPVASVNFVTAHDGFTLRDLVSYNEKHNEANLEENKDGTDTNRSWNHGVEGEASADIEALRRRSMRNLLGTLVLSAGTPMLVAGDEFGRTQGGNNNSYCQDNEISWVNWECEPWQEDLRETVRYLLDVRACHEVLRPEAFYTNAVFEGDEIAELAWFDAFGQLMPDYCWFDPNYPVLQMLRSGFEYDGSDVLLVFNRSSQPQAVTLPQGRGTNYKLMWDSSWERPRDSHEVYSPAARTRLEANSMRLFLSN